MRMEGATCAARYRVETTVVEVAVAVNGCERPTECAVPFAESARASFEAELLSPRPRSVGVGLVLVLCVDVDRISAA